jgi:cell division protein FtsI/penicillin-binding protein 2
LLSPIFPGSIIKPFDIQAALKDTLKFFEQRLFAVICEKACGHRFLEYPSIMHLPDGGIVV